MTHTCRALCYLTVACRVSLDRTKCTQQQPTSRYLRFVIRHRSACCLAPTACDSDCRGDKSWRTPSDGVDLTGWSLRRLTWAPPQLAWRNYNSRQALIAAAEQHRLHALEDDDRQERAVLLIQAMWRAHKAKRAQKNRRVRPRDSRAHFSVGCHELIAVLGVTSSLWC